MQDAGDGSELVDPQKGGQGRSEGASRGDEQRGGENAEGPIPQGGGAVGGPADPVAGTAEPDDDAG